MTQPVLRVLTTSLIIFLCHSMWVLLLRWHYHLLSLPSLTQTLIALTPVRLTGRWLLTMTEIITAVIYVNTCQYCQILLCHAVILAAANIVLILIQLVLSCWTAWLPVPTGVFQNLASSAMLFLDGTYRLALLGNRQTFGIKFGVTVAILLLVFSFRLKENEKVL